MVTTGLRRGLIAISVGGMCSCSSAFTPQERGTLVIVGDGEASELSVISLAPTASRNAIGPIPRFKDTYAYSEPRNRLYVVAFDNAISRTLITIDATRLTVLMRSPLSGIRAPGIGGGSYSLYGNTVMSPSHDGDQLIMDGFCNASRALLSMSTSTLSITGAICPLVIRPGGLTSLPPQSGRSRFLVAGSRRDDYRAPHLFIVALSPLEVIDSIPVSSLIAPGTVISHVVASGDSLLFFKTSTSILKFDLREERLVTSIASPSRGSLSLSIDGSRLYVTDPGDGRDFPGSGLVYQFTSDLVSLPPIDLRAVLTDTTPTTNRITFTPDGRWLLVSSGTGSLGPLYGPQPGRVFVIDAVTGITERVLRTGDWLARWMVVP